MSAGSLRKRTLGALSWSFFDAIVNRVLSALIAILLARSLSPEDFGLMGMLAIVIALASLIVEGGLTAALIRKPEVTPHDINTVFYINVGVGATVAAALYLASSAIASFYHEPDLAPVAAAMSLLFVLSGVSAVQTAQLTKDLRFNSLAIASAVSVLVSGALSVTMAKMGFGVWSLVAQQLSLVGSRALCLWIVSTWRPKLQFSLESFRELFGFGWRILASSVLGRSFENLPSIIIGRVYGAIDLGYFTRADMLQRIPAQSLSQVVNRVSLPVFASIQNQPERLRTGMRKALALLVFVNFPMMAGLAVTAEPLVVTLLTERWLPVVPLLQLLSLVGLFYPVHAINLNLLQASGHAGLYLRVAIIKHVLLVVNFAITWSLGVKAIIGGLIVHSLVCYFLNARYSHTLVGYGAWRQARDIAPYALATGLMSVMAWTVGRCHFTSAIVELVLQAIAGGATYLVTCALLRLEAFSEALREIRERLGR